MKKQLVETSTYRDYLHVQVRMTYKKLWSKLQPDEQVQALMQMATALRELAEQMENEATELVERIQAYPSVTITYCERE